MDVLSLIAKILSLTDDQLEIVGLRVPSKNIFSSIISSFVPGEQKEPSADTEVHCFALLCFTSLWISVAQQLPADCNTAQQGIHADALNILYNVVDRR